MGMIKSSKQQALKTLKGKWGLAVGSGILQFLITNAASFVIGFVGAILFAIISIALWEPVYTVVSILTDVVIYLLVILFSSLFLIGYRWMFLDLQLGRPAGVESLFLAFQHGRFLKLTGASLLLMVYTILWTLLLIVPGVIKACAYSQTLYILKDHPEYTINQAITESRKMMDGYKGEYFLLNLSFIGWAILALITLLVGFLWLCPYILAAHAAYYQHFFDTGEAGK